MPAVPERRADRPVVALFDFDGTLTRRELMPDFMRFAVPRHRLVLGYLLLWPFIVGYKLGWTSGVTVRRMIVRFGFGGMPAARFAELGRQFAAERIPPELRPDLMARLAVHRERGDRVVVVSGALDIYLAPWCADHGLELVCSTLEARDGRMTGHYRGAQCVNDEKVRRVRALIGSAGDVHIVAYGDTPEDAAMLAMADEAWWCGARAPDDAAFRRLG